MSNSHCQFLLIFRLQVQTGNSVYSGTYDAGRKIFHSEGFKGLYRGFFVSAFQVVSGVCYVSTYESVRHILDKQGIVTDNKIKAFVGKKISNESTLFNKAYWTKRE